MNQQPNPEALDKPRQSAGMPLVGITLKEVLAAAAKLSPARQGHAAVIDPRRLAPGGFVVIVGHYLR